MEMKQHRTFIQAATSLIAEADWWRQYVDAHKERGMGNAHLTSADEHPEFIVLYAMNPAEVFGNTCADALAEPAGHPEENSTREAAGSVRQWA